MNLISRWLVNWAVSGFRGKIRNNDEWREMIGVSLDHNIVVRRHFNLLNVAGEFISTRSNKSWNIETFTSTNCVRYWENYTTFWSKRHCLMLITFKSYKSDKIKLTLMKCGRRRPTEYFAISVVSWQQAAPNVKNPTNLYKFWSVIGTFQLKSFNFRSPSKFNFPRTISVDTI